MLSKETWNWNSLILEEYTNTSREYQTKLIKDVKEYSQKTETADLKTLG